MMTDETSATDLHAGMGVPPVLTKVFGLLSVLFFGLCAVAVITKWLDRRPGFVVDGAGINDNSSATSAGFVPWGDITGFGTHGAPWLSPPTLLVYVSNPAAYIHSAPNALTRFTRWANHKLLGTPVTVTATTLACSHEELQMAVSAGRDASLA